MNLKSKRMVETENDEQISLPQPKRPQDERYEYVLYEDIDERFFGGRLAPGNLCWVLKGKTSHGKAHKLFNRVRVVQDDEGGAELDPVRRILVRYSKGATYRVKRSNLVPVLEAPISSGKRFVLLMAETPDYRRAVVVHTCTGDSFLEIGCDFGPCVDRVQRSLNEIDDVPRDPKDGPVTLPPADQGRVWCIGIDKSPHSIEIAVNRFPACTFSIEDALEASGVEQLQQLCKTTLQNGYPSVVAVDINGNREIPAVLQCVDNIMNPVGETWIMPRIILVKSRLLHVALRPYGQNTNRYLPTKGCCGC